MEKKYDTVTNQRGSVVPDVAVTVYIHDGTLQPTVKATIYSDNGSTVRSNPIITDARGYFEFYAADGHYDIKIVGPGIIDRWVYDILLEDPADGSAALAASGGAGLVGFIQSGTGAVARTVQDKLRDVVSVNDKGAIGDDVTDCSAAIALADVNDAAVVFIKGGYRVSSNTTINKNALFWPNAYLVIDVGVTVTFNGPIEAGPSQIFTGAGNVLLNEERSHTVKPEWFGAIPDDATIDCGVGLQKLSDSVVSGRECYINLAAATYYIATPVIWSRACRVHGSGQRMTHFRIDAAFPAGDIFSTSGEGVEFLNLHFSMAAGSRTAGALIKLANQRCHVHHIRAQSGFIGVDVQADGAQVEDVIGIAPWATTTGSCLVNMGNNTARPSIRRINNETDQGQVTGPEYVVLVSTAKEWSVEDVKDTNSSVSALGVVVSAGNCFRGIVDNIIANASARAIYLKNTGTAVIDQIEIGKVLATSCTVAGMEVRKESSGRLAYFGVAGLHAASCAVGFKTSSSSGTVDHWQVRGGFARQSTGNGYDIANATRFNVSDIEAFTNGGTGTLIAAGCSNFVCANNNNQGNTTAQLTDNSGAVTKAVANNI